MAGEKLSKAQIALLEPEERDEYRAMRRKTAKQAVKYAICTLSAGGIELITNTILINTLNKIPALLGKMTFIVETDIYVFIATTVALIFSIMWNFTVNRKFTFKSGGNVPRAMFLAFLFYVPFYPFKIWFNGSLPYLAFAGAVGGASVYLAANTIFLTLFNVCSMLLNGVFEFMWQKFFIYRNEEDSAVTSEVGTIGEYGEITLEKPVFSADELLDLMRAGVDITMSDKKLKKELKRLSKCD